MGKTICNSNSNNATHSINRLFIYNLLQDSNDILDDHNGVVPVEFSFVHLAVPQEKENSLRQSVVGGQRLHTDESTGIAQTSSSEGLISRRSVIVEGELGLAGHPVYADGPAG